MITIALAAYNGEKYLKEQMDSLLSQSIAEKIKIVAADDGSSDGTFNILSDYAADYPDTVMVYKNEPPTGSAGGNFFGLMRNVDDDYIMFSDQDDVWLPEKAEYTLNKMKQMEKEYGAEKPLLVFSDVMVVDAGLNVISKSMAEYQKTAPHHNKLNNYLVQNNIIGCSVMINRAMLEYMKSEPETYMMHDWWMGLVASAFGHIGFIDKPLLKYRQHGDNQMGTRAAGDASQYIERLSQGDKVRKNYEIMFRQAEIFLDMYGDRLTQKQKEIINGFLSIRKSCRIKKIYKIFRYRLFKSTWFWTLGQCFSI